ncbi:MAG: hypothetical protein VX589_17615 [Myxococcota bacterium]|nr:hypothetical protein [Myxococcota bacterium]
MLQCIYFWTIARVDSILLPKGIMANQVNSTSTPYRSLSILVALIASAIAIGSSTAMGRTDGLLMAHVIASSIALLAVAASWVSAVKRFGGATVKFTPRAPHILQLLAHSTVFGYWTLHHVPLESQLWLIFAQIPFAYAIDLAISWSRYGQYRLGFGPLPVVGSINLFLWMTDPWFIVQYGMVAVAFLSRELLRRTVDGTSRHIFNPSAIALALVSLVLLATGTSDVARGAEIATSLGKGPYCFESILIAGLIVQLAFPVIWTTLGAITTLVALGTIFQGVTGGVYFIDTAIPIAVFLGTMLLITDPATSPESHRGKFVFGVLYGASVFALFTALEAYGDQPWGENVTYFDKLLAVPLLNLASPTIERWTQRIALGRTIDGWSGTRARCLVALAWVVAYAGLRPQLTQNEGRNIEFWQTACSTNPAMCDRFAMAWQSRCQSTKASPACDRAAPLILERACSEGLETACLTIAQRQMQGSGGYGLDIPSARRTLERSCLNGRVDVCGELGKHLFQAGESMDGMRKTALNRACRGNDWVACELYGALLHEKAQTTEEFRYARDVLIIACSANRPMACSTLGHLLVTGRSGRKDITEAKRVVGKACDQDFEPACRYLKTIQSLPTAP